MDNATPTPNLAFPSGSEPRLAPTIVFVALALVYAASGVLNALQAASGPPAGVLRAAVLALLPSIAVMMVLWITHIQSLSPKARRSALAATLIATGLVATISTFGP